MGKRLRMNYISKPCNTISSLLPPPPQHHHHHLCHHHHHHEHYHLRVSYLFIVVFFLNLHFPQLRNNTENAIATQLADTQGDNRSPILAAFQNNPRNLQRVIRDRHVHLPPAHPVLFLSSIEGKFART
eukprot:757601-Hanusia_phi.AAC.1